MLVRLLPALLLWTTSLNALVVGYDAINGGGAIGNPDAATYTVGFNQVAGGVNLSGVVLISSGEGTCTGSLLSDGVSILTAAHCMSTPGITAQIYFIGSSGLVQYVVSAMSDFFVDPAWYADGENSTLGDDLGIIRLGTPAPSFAVRYDIYTGDATVINAPIEMAGWGDSGTGLTGANESVYPYGPPGEYPCDAAAGGCALRQGQNVYIANGADFASWSPNVSIGYFADAVSPNGILNQVDIAPGDSGGPSFYNGQIIGIHDFTACVGSGCSPNSAFGTYWGDTFPGSKSNIAWIESVEASEPTSSWPVALGLLAGYYALKSWKATRPNETA